MIGENEKYEIDRGNNRMFLFDISCFLMSNL